MRAYSFSRTRLRAFRAVLLGAAAWAIPTQAWPQSGGVACFLAPAKLPDSVVAKFTANPAILLAEYPGGGPALMSAARRLAGSDVRTVDALIEVARSAPPELKVDIATGLANTAASCVWTRPDIARVIQEKIANAGDAPLATAFLSVLRAGGTAALGGGAGGPAGAAREIGTTRGGAPIGGGGVEPSATSQGEVVQQLGSARRAVDSNGTAGGTDNAGGADGVTPGSINNVARSSGNNRLFKPDVSVSPTMQ